MTTALIVGAGAGLSASLARKLAARGMKLSLGPHEGVRSPFVIDGERCGASLPAPVLGEADGKLGG